MHDNFDELLRLAALTESESADDLRELERGLDRLDAADKPLAVFALKLLQGKPYAVTSNSPETLARYRAFADHVGAVIEVIEGVDWPAPGLTKIVFRPPPAQ
jgi:hypothetical protein